MTGGTHDLPLRWTVVEADETSALVRSDVPGEPVPAGFEARTVTLEELALAYLRVPAAGVLPGPMPL